MNPLDELAILVMQPQDVPAKVRILGLILAKAEAGPAAALLGASIANLIGNIPDDKWEEMASFVFPECGTPGCNCHIVQTELFKSLKMVREIFIRATENPDEQGLAE